MEVSLEKEKDQSHTLATQKKEVEHELLMLKHEKTAFIEILATANRTESTIFDDGEESALRSTSLSELANDISLLVRGLKKRISSDQERNTALEESLR